MILIKTIVMAGGKSDRARFILIIMSKRINVK